MALSAEQLRRGFRVGDRLVEPARNCIRGPEGETHVEPKVMAVLLSLAEHAGEVVPRAALYDAVWGKAVVSDQALTNCISELRQHLGSGRADRQYIETVPKRGYRLVVPVLSTGAGEAAVPAEAGAGRRRLLAASAVASLGILGVLGWWSLAGTEPPDGAVVVVPFENAGNDESLAYLGLALPDEITTLLTASGDLVVRPFAPAPAGTPLAVGREREAAHVVTGHYYREAGDQLTVAVEAQDVAGERLVWRARITVPAGDLLALRAELSQRVRRGLLPALGAAAPILTAPPADREAYQLYLRSLALPSHPEPTEDAIELLTRAVDLDPGFAPAWTALGTRWYASGNYGEGGETAIGNALAAWQQALALDPAALPAAVGIVKLRTESGDLAEAYVQARRLVDRFASKAEAHLALAYVYKYGGMLEASQRHCDTAFARDPYNPDLRSCAYSFLYAGKLGRVQAFLDADEGSYFSQWGTVLLNLRRGDDAAALISARQVSPDRHTRRFMEPCLEGRRGAELDEAAAAFVAFWSTHHDPELAFGLAPMLEYCGRREEALVLLRHALAAGFCGWPALDTDPIWAGLRDDPRFRGLREDAVACHRRFREAVERTPVQAG